MTRKYSRSEISEVSAQHVVALEGLTSNDFVFAMLILRAPTQDPRQPNIEEIDKLRGESRNSIWALLTLRKHQVDPLDCARIITIIDSDEVIERIPRLANDWISPVRPSAAAGLNPALPLMMLVAILVAVSFMAAYAREAVAEAPVSSALAESNAQTDNSNSNYAETVPAAGGSKSVGSELIEADQRNDAIFDIDWIHVLAPRHYRRKQTINERIGIAYNVDYSLLSQTASFSVADKDAASSVFRIYGNWLAYGDKKSSGGNLVFKFEHRGAIFGDQTPRDLGFNTGSALSTANYKENGWGFTDLYWKQIWDGGRNSILFGHMDPGDWADQHALLNAWTNLLNDAFYNNPTEAIPKRTFSLVGRLGLPHRWYLGAGIHDANGKDNDIDFRQVWDTPELFSWVELGFRPSNYSTFGETTHIHFWHQDEREAAGVEESWGVTASMSKVLHSGITHVVRAGYAEGDAPQLREFVGYAVSFPARGSDSVKFGVGWGSPPDKSLRSQVVLEALYRLHLTQNMTVSPDLQITFNPSFNDVEDTVYVVGLRMRFKF